LTYRFLTVDPYRVPKPRVGPTFFVFGNAFTNPVSCATQQPFLVQSSQRPKSAAA
jgi:hypothetical protein